jgi:hypothetical protein
MVLRFGFRALLKEASDLATAASATELVKSYHNVRIRRILDQVSEAKQSSQLDRTTRRGQLLICTFCAAYYSADLLEKFVD